jgi:hypothetical protein
VYVEPELQIHKPVIPGCFSCSSVTGNDLAKGHSGTERQKRQSGE